MTRHGVGGLAADTEARVDVLRQITDGLRYLHSRKLVHRDIKPMNVLVRPRPQSAGGGFVVKLSDLEFAKELGSSGGAGGAQASTFAGGTQDWQAPEVFMREANTKGSDVFSLGPVGLLCASCLLALRRGTSLAHNTCPRSSLPPYSLLPLRLVVFFVCTGGAHALGGSRERTDNLMKLKYTHSADHLRPLLARAGLEAADLVGAMLAPEPASRPDAGAVLAHPFFWSVGEKVRYVDRVHRSFSTAGGLKDAVDAGGGACWGGGDWRLQKGLPAALWPRAAPGRFVHAGGSTSQYGNRASELVRLIRNLSQHFSEQRPELRRAILAGGGGDGGALSVEEQEAAVGRCFFGAFPGLLVHLRRAEAQAADGSK